MVQYRKQVIALFFLVLLWPNIAVSKSIEFVILTVGALIILFNDSIEADALVKCVSLFTIVGVISWIKAIFTQEFTLERIIAALILCVIWFVAVIIYDLFRKININWDRISFVFFVNYMIWIASAILFLVFVKLGIASEIYHIEYNRARFDGWFEYSTLNVPFAIMHSTFASFFVWRRTHNKLLVILCYMLQWIPLYYTYSRSGYVLVALQMVGYIFYFLLMAFKKRKVIKKGISLIFICLIPVLPIFGYVIFKAFNMLIGLREGSNISRMYIYTETIDKFIENPLIGNGIKSYTAIGYPLGSHCMYLGFLYRVGIIGAGIILFGIAVTIKKIWECRKIDDFMWVSSFVNVLFMLAFAIFEDLDGEYWLLCMFFFYLGILQNSSVFENKKL